MSMVEGYWQRRVAAVARQKPRRCSHAWDIYFFNECPICIEVKTIQNQRIDNMKMVPNSLIPKQKKKEA